MDSSFSLSDLKAVMGEGGGNGLTDRAVHIQKYLDRYTGKM